MRAATEARLIDFLLDTEIRAGSYFQLDERVTTRLRHGRAGRPLGARNEANAWLIVETANWFGALHWAAAQGRHRQVVDLGEVMHYYCNTDSLHDIWPQVFQLTTDAARAAGLHAEEVAERNNLGWALLLRTVEVYETDRLDWICRVHSQ